MINDDTLLLFHYGDELTREEQARIAEAIQSDVALERRYTVLVASLPRTEQPDVPISNALKQSLHGIIESDRRPSLDRPSKRQPMQRWAGIAIAASLLVGLLVLAPLGEKPPPVEVVEKDDRSAADPLSSILAVHFMDARDTLVSLGDSTISKQETPVAQLALRTQRIALAADAANAHDYARVLRAFALRVGDLASATADSEESQVLKDQLLFEANSMLTKLGQDPSNRV